MADSMLIVFTTLSVGTAVLFTGFFLYSEWIKTARLNLVNLQPDDLHNCDFNRQTTGSNDGTAPEDQSRDTASGGELQVQDDVPSTLATDGQHQETAVIYKGTNAAIVDFPWAVAIGIHRWPLTMLGRLAENQAVKTSCTGALIGPNWVLTAGHCVKAFMHRYYVTAGTDCRPEYGGQLVATKNRVRVRKVYYYRIHGLGWSWKEWLPRWQIVVHGRHGSGRDTLKYDLAVLQLEESILQEGNPNIRPIEWEAGDQFEEDSVAHLANLTLVGWGNAFSTDNPKRLQHYTTTNTLLWRGQLLRSLRPHADQDCLNARLLICLNHGFDTPSPASGDSGGPWVVRRQDGSWLLVGALSNSLSFQYDSKSKGGSADQSPQRLDEDELDLVPPQGQSDQVKTGRRPGAGEYEVSVAVRLRAKDEWIRQHVTGGGFSAWRRCLNGIAIFGRCFRIRR